MKDKIKHTNHKGRQHMTNYWSDSLSPPVELPNYHNSFPLDLDDHKNQMESPPILSVQVWSVIWNTWFQIKDWNP